MLEFPKGKRPAAMNEADEPMTATPAPNAINIFEMPEGAAAADFHPVLRLRRLRPLCRTGVKYVF